MMKRLWIFTIACMATVASSQPVITPPPFNPIVGVLPSYNDANWNWQNAGLQKIGGIPNRTTVCTTVNAIGGAPPFTNDDSQNIATAISGCTPGQVVQLSAGTFNFSSNSNIEYIILNKSITLRGTGNCSNASSPYCQTVLNFYDGLIPFNQVSAGPICGTSPSSQVTCGAFGMVYMGAGGNPNDYGFSGALGSCGAGGASAIGCGTQLDADAAKGDLTIRVHSLTGFNVGGWAVIDEASGAMWVNDPVGPNQQGQIYAAPDWLSTSGSPATGRIAWEKYTVSGGEFGPTDYPYNGGGTKQAQQDRPTTETHLITSVGAGPCPGVQCTITFDDPLMIAYRVSGQTTFTGSISSTALATTGDNCTTVVGQIVDDPPAHGILDGTYIATINSCSGGVGSYVVNKSQTVSSRTMNAGAHQAHVYFPTDSNATPRPLQNEVGLENLTIKSVPSGAVNIIFCSYCWMKNVEVVNWYGGGVKVANSTRTQLDSIYMNLAGYSVNSGGEYPISFEEGTTESYLVNSIITSGGKGMVGKAGGGNVIAYNYFDKEQYDDSIGDTLVDMSANCSHWNGTHHCLFEGNWANNLDNDNTHGAAIYHTYFRNWGTALRTSYTDTAETTCNNGTMNVPCLVEDNVPVNGVWNSEGGYSWTCNAGSCHLNGSGLRAAGPMEHNYWYAYVGNVLGTPGITTTANNWLYNGTNATNISIWWSGWNSNFDTKPDPNLDGTNTPRFMHRHGNYDYVNNSIFEWAAGFSHAMPNSFYLPQRPSFFGPGATCTYTWPWVTPETGTQIHTNSCGNSGLPAKARYDAGTPFVQP